MKSSASVVCILQMEVGGTEEETCSTRSPNKKVTNLKFNLRSLAPQPEFLPVTLSQFCPIEPSVITEVFYNG